MPGPNDYNINRTTGELDPGLGKDELSEEQRIAMRSKSGQAMLRLKEEVAAQSAELTERERQMEAREQAILRREAELKVAESRVAKGAKPAKAGSDDAEPDVSKL